VTSTATSLIPVHPPDTVEPTVDVSVIVVAFRTPDLVARCVQSVHDQNRGLVVEVLVVENDPQDGTAQALAELDAPCRVISPGANLGFARAVNLAAVHARGRYLLLLNPDALVVDAAVDRLVEFADRRPGHGLYGGRTVDGVGRLDPRSCWGLPTLWSTLCFAVGLSSLCKRHPLFDPESLGRWERDSVQTVDVVTGCLCLVPSDTWRALGGFDEQFFVYGEDVDLAVRARSVGFRPLLCPDATVVHEVGRASATRADKLLLLHRGKVSLFRKHWTPRRARLGVALLRTGVVVRGALAGGSWRELHRRRHDWVDGHPELAA